MDVGHICLTIDKMQTMKIDNFVPLLQISGCMCEYRQCTVVFHVYAIVKSHYK